jgi:plastocyanin
MKEEQEEKKNQTLNLSKLATTVLSFAGLIIVASILPTTLITTTISMKTAFAQQQTPTEIISTVRTLLNQTINEYRNQNFTGAQSLASSAYLDHFEFIEAPLEKHDKVLKENTEIMLREQLRQSIKDKSPDENIQQLINKININLDQAERLLADTESLVQTTSATTSANQTNTIISSIALNTVDKVIIAGDEVKESYIPGSIIIKTADNVSWINTDEEVHTVTSGFESNTDKGKQFDSGLLNVNQTFVHTFDKAGMYNYFCTIHPIMTGLVNVN